METKKEDSLEQLKEVPTSELLDALCKAEIIKPELEARGRAFLKDVLSKEGNFPTDVLNQCTVKVKVTPDEGGAIIIKVPLSRLWDENPTDAHERQCELVEEWSSLPGVAKVTTYGSMDMHGILYLNVVLESDQIPAQDPSQAVEEVQKGVSKDLSKRVIYRKPKLF